MYKEFRQSQVYYCLSLYSKILEPSAEL